jgi:L-lactate dehydrogenase complex protein LldG
MERAEFIGRIHNRLAAVPKLEAEVPAGWGVTIADRGARFEQELTAIGGVVHRVARAEAASVLERWAGGVFLTTREEDLPPGIEEAVARGGGELLRWPDATLDEVAATVDVGVTSALWGVAETGSVLVSSAPPGGRAPSLVVPVHVVFLPEARVLGTVEEVFATIDTFKELPSNLVLITGPSKSADIGMELAVGVHGPGEIHVVLT